MLASDAFWIDCGAASESWRPRRAASVRPTGDLVFQGQKAVGKFGIEGIQSAIR